MIEFEDCNTLLYKDLSIWVEVPETYQIKITYFGGELLVIVTTNTTTIIEGNFPSGIYCIEVINCNGNTIKSEFLNLCKLECELKNKIASIDFCKINDKELADLQKLLNYILFAKAKFNCEWCDSKEITKYLDLLKKELTDDCNCKK